MTKKGGAIYKALTRSLSTLNSSYTNPFQKTVLAISL